MFTVYPTKMKSMINMHKKFETEGEAKKYIASRNNPANYTLESEGTKIDHTEEVVEKVAEDTAETKKASGGQKKTSEAKKEIDFTGAVEINRKNVKFFYKKEGFIKVVDPVGTTLHIGKTRNMGKVFSNYVNCAKYNQSYDFNLDNGDKLYFKECPIA